MVAKLESTLRARVITKNKTIHTLCVQIKQNINNNGITAVQRINARAQSGRRIKRAKNSPKMAYLYLKIYNYIFKIIHIFFKTDL